MIIFFEIAGILIVVVGLGLFYLLSKYSPEKIVQYIADNPKNGSIYLVRNNIVVIDKNSDNLMPLASTVKIIIALEFTRQASNQKIDVDERIKISELDKYYIETSDGGAHIFWKKSLNKKKVIQNNQVSLLEVAQGMIEFSSNANSEYLLDKLGFDNVNMHLKALGLIKHDKIYPFVSCLLVLRDHSLQQLNEMPKDEYIELSFKVHEKLKNASINKKMMIKDASFEKQKYFSKWFPRGTVKEYVSILNKINSRTYFNKKEQELIDYLMKVPFKMSDGSTVGEKMGGTRFILTTAIYLTSLDGNKSQLALFLNNLSGFQNKVYQFTLAKLKFDLLRDKNIDVYENILR